MDPRDPQSGVNFGGLRSADLPYKNLVKESIARNG